MKQLKLLAVVAALAVYTGFVADVATRPAGGIAWRNLSPYAWLFQGVPVEATYFPTPIKSITPIDITFGGATTATQTVSVNAASSLLVMRGSHSSDNSSGGYTQSTIAYGKITNGTTITATAGQAINSPGAWNGDLIEFIPQFVKSANCVAPSWNETSLASATVGITTVVPSKTTLAFTGWQTTNPGSTYTFDGMSQVMTQTTPKIALTSSTVITGSKDATGGSWVVTVGGCYVEFK